MHKNIGGELCTGCGACYNICPQNSIRMIEDLEGFLYPEMDAEQCIHCGKCETVCPVNPVHLSAEEPGSVEAYAAYSLDESIRRKSSSGGLFFELAKQIIASDGAVFGAAFQPDMSVKHQMAENMQELETLLGSKYVQSDIADSYRVAENLLRLKRPVLFTGTPCQIAGLHKYLGKNYDNLITQDIVCHGVPSPLVWRNYLARKKQEFHSGVSSVCFRDKSHGWKSFSMRAEFDNRKVYIQKAGHDLYMRTFLMNYSLRPSCYHCVFKTHASGSDITLADYWGIEHCHPEMADDKGTSLVLVHSLKGTRLFEHIQRNISFQRTDVKMAAQWNPPMYKPVAPPQHRSDFMTTMRNVSFDKAAIKYCRPPSLIKRFLRKMKKLIMYAIC